MCRWVEHDPMEIWHSVSCCIEKCLHQAKSKHPELKVTALGITNQRETTMAWDSRTGVLLTAWGCRQPLVVQSVAGWNMSEAQAILYIAT